MLKTQDYGCDPLPDGTFRMVPSGDIVSLTERNKRLAHTVRQVEPDCFGLTWEQIALKQGGLSTLDIVRKAHKL